MQPPHMATTYPDDMPMVDFDSRMIRAITQQPWSSVYHPLPPHSVHHPQLPHHSTHTQPLLPHFPGKDLHMPPAHEQPSTVTVLDISQANPTSFTETTPRRQTLDSASSSNQTQVEQSCRRLNAAPTMVHTCRPSPQKRQRNPDLWKKNVRKKARQTGQAYVTDAGKKVPARKIREGCNSTCRLGCHNSFDLVSREDLFQTFWGLEDKNQQRQYIARHVIKCEIARKRVGASDRRGFTLKYFFYNGKELSQVCRKFFVETLDVGRDFIYGTLEKEDPKTGLIAPERQGKHGKQRRVSEAVVNSVREHILTFPTVNSYHGKSKSKRQYLEAGLSVAKMFRMYKEYCCVKNIQTVASADRYRRVFDEDFNLAFLKAKKT